MGRRMIDLTGRRFGKLTAIKTVGKDADGCYNWVCRCDCGNEVVTKARYLLSRGTRSCGCLKSETHTALYAKAKAEKAMKAPEAAPDQVQEYHPYRCDRSKFNDDWMFAPDYKVISRTSGIKEISVAELRNGIKNN